MPRCGHRRHEPTRLRLGVDAQLGGPLERRRGDGVATTQSSSIGAAFQLARNVGVGPGGGSRSMPGAPIGFELSAERVRQGEVSGTAFARRRTVVDRGSDERMAQLDVGSRDADEADLLRRAERLSADPCHLSSPQHRRERTRLVGGNQQELPLRRGRQAPDALQEQRFDVAGQRERLRQRLGARELCPREGGRELDERERVPGRLLDQASAHRRRDPRADAADQRSGRIGIERRQRQLGDVPSLEPTLVAFARREQEHDSFRLQAPRDEQQRVRRRVVEPLGIVDEAQQGPLLGDVAQQPEHAESDPEAIVRGLARQGEGGAKRCRLRLRQPIDPVQQWPQQLVQAGERELGLGLDPGRAQHGHAMRALGHVREQGGLPDACLAPEHERRASSITRIRQQTVEYLGLDLAADEHAPIVFPTTERAAARDRPGARTPGSARRLLECGT